MRDSIYVYMHDTTLKKYTGKLMFVWFFHGRIVEW